MLKSYTNYTSIKKKNIKYHKAKRQLTSQIISSNKRSFYECRYRFTIKKEEKGKEQVEHTE